MCTYDRQAIGEGSGDPDVAGWAWGEDERAEREDGADASTGEECSQNIAHYKVQV